MKAPPERKERPVAARVAKFVTEWLHANRDRNKAELGRLLGMSGSWVTRLIAGDRGLTVDYLDPLADVLGVTPSELVRRDEHEIWELRASEVRLLSAFRALSKEEKESLLSMALSLAKKADAGPTRRWGR